MSRRSRVLRLRTHSTTTFPEGTGILKIQKDPITRIQMTGRRPDQSISPVSNHCAPSLGSLEDRRGYCYDFTSFSVPLFLLSLFNLTSFFHRHLFSSCLLIHAYSCAACLFMRLLIRLLMHTFAYSCAYSYTSLLTHTQ